MDFSFTEEQSMLRDTIASYLADNYSFDQRRAALGREPFWRPDVWSAFADELGILGAAFPEAQGGLGVGYTENMVVMEELGKALVVEPHLSTVVIGGGFLKHGAPAGAEELIGQIIAGKAIFAFAYAEPQGRYNIRDLKTTARKDGTGSVLNGHKAVVTGAPYATHLVVTARTGGGQRDAGGISVFIVPKSAKGVTTRDYPTVDGFRASEVYFENVALGAEARIGGEGEALPLVEKVMDEAIAATCAEACDALFACEGGAALGLPSATLARFQRAGEAEREEMLLPETSAGKPRRRRSRGARGGSRAEEAGVPEGASAAPAGGGAAGE